MRSLKSAARSGYEVFWSALLSSGKHLQDTRPTRFSRVILKVFAGQEQNFLLSRMRPALTTQLDCPHLLLPLTLPPYLYTLPSRSNPVLMIRTFAYQLAEAVPALRPHLMPPKLTTEEVAVLADAEIAFHRLLLQPLNEVC